MHPVLASFDFSKMCMIHIASPHIIPAGWAIYNLLEVAPGKTNASQVEDSASLALLF